MLIAERNIFFFEDLDYEISDSFDNSAFSYAYNSPSLSFICDYLTLEEKEIFTLFLQREKVSLSLVNIKLNQSNRQNRIYVSNYIL